MEDYVIEILSGITPKKLPLMKFRDENEFLIVQENTKKILVLNSTAREIYNSCDGKIVNEIIKNLGSLYPDLNNKKLSLDVLKCLRDLEKRDLISLRNKNEGITCDI